MLDMCVLDVLIFLNILDIPSKPHQPGYSCVSIPRSCRGGGVALFIKDTIIFKCRHDLSNINDNSFESVFIEILNSRKRKLIIGCIYRPPGRDINVFNDQFERLLQSISSGKSEYLLAGDYNVDLFKYETNTGTESFVNNLYCHSCLSLITRPTRFTEVSSTLKDNIITNTFNECSSYGVLIADISDHLPIFLYIKRACND